MIALCLFSYACCCEVRYGGGGVLSQMVVSDHVLIQHVLLIGGAVGKVGKKDSESFTLRFGKFERGWRS